MSLKERVYSILLVSATDALASALSELLPVTKCSSIRTATNISSAKRKIADQSFDFIIINTPLPDDFGTRFAIDVCTAKHSVVLLLVKNDIHDSIHNKVAEYGVFTLPKPTSKPTLLQALNWLESAREPIRLFQKKSFSIEEKMAEIRQVNKAKWILISELKMNEPDAHHYIEKQAMDRCTTKKYIAEEIIKTYT